jgi:hypothetical protein
MFEEPYFIPGKEIAAEWLLEPSYRHGFTRLEEGA